jgi:hypothetical protein
MTHRLTFETVGTQYLGLYSNADPRWYSNTTQIVPNSEIPDEHWHEVSRVAELADLEDQYRTLKGWAEADAEFVRKVRLEQLVAEPTWVEVQL